VRLLPDASANALDGATFLLVKLDASPTLVAEIKTREVDMPFYSDDVFVIKTDDPIKLRDFFTKLGLSFVQEQHDGGPVHYACEVNGKVFEIYPKGVSP
jgi:hypothetical protein